MTVGPGNDSGGRGRPELMTLGETMAVLNAPRDVPLRYAANLELGMAGAESNVAIGVRRLGHRVAWMGRVGDDEFGRMILGRLRAEEVDVRAATVDRDAPTGLMLKEARADGRVRVSYYRRNSAGSRLAPEHLDERQLVGAGLLHVTGITAALSASARRAVEVAAQAARGAGVTVSFDVNYRSALWPEDEAAVVLRGMLGNADIVFATEQEAAMLCGPWSAEELARRLQAEGPSQAIVKRGASGALAQVLGEAYDVGAVVVPVVDPVGAGDAFAAGYLSALIDGAAPEERLRRAALVAAFAVSGRGDWENLPERAELDTLGADPVRR